MGQYILNLELFLCLGKKKTWVINNIAYRKYTDGLLQQKSYK